MPRSHPPTHLSDQRDRTGRSHNRMGWFDNSHRSTFASRTPTSVTNSSQRYRNNATATSPTIFIDFAETLSIVSSSVW
jgi:hypothetical protein